MKILPYVEISKHFLFLTLSKPLDGKIDTQHIRFTFGLNHGLATQQKESDIIAFTESVQDQGNLVLSVRKYITMLRELKTI